MATSPQVHQYRCPSCGGSQAFDPKDGCLTCPNCHREETIPASKEQVVERSYEEYLKARPEDMKALSDNAVQVTCEGCGASVTFEPPDVATQCPFCGAQIVNQPESADVLVAPQGLLPFTITLAAALEGIRAWLASRWFLPDALKKVFKQESIFGVYLPFWNFDSFTTSHYTGERGDHYYTTESYTTTDAQGNNVTEERQVMHTAWSPAAGAVQRLFKDLLMPATQSLPPARLVQLDPWDLPGLKAYDPAYLAGFKAHRYQLDPTQGFEMAKQTMQQQIAEDVRRDIGGDEQRILDVATSYTAVAFEHLLLPVWLCAYRFQDKVYHVMVNGRTGEVIGERPHSAAKIAILVVVLLVAAAIIALIASQK